MLYNAIIGLANTAMLAITPVFIKIANADTADEAPASGTKALPTSSKHIPMGGQTIELT